MKFSTIIPLMLLTCVSACRGNGTRNPGEDGKSGGLQLDSTTATIRLEPIADGYRISLQPKENANGMAARCLSWTLGKIKGAKVVTGLEANEDACNDESFPLGKAEAFIRIVKRNRSAIAEAYGEDYAPKLLSAHDPVILLEGIGYLGGQSRFLEIPEGETEAILAFQANDSCPNRAGTVEGCEKRVLPPPSTGVVRMKLKIKTKDDQIEIH